MIRDWGTILVGTMVLVFLPGQPVSAVMGLRSKQTVLITGFQPFDGRARNNSYEMAKRLQADPSLLGANVDVKICELPVVYDRAASVAKDCFQKLETRPDFVVSLGEGGCDIRLETAATNLDDVASADNDGVVRQGHVIDPELPSRLGLTLAVDRSYCDWTQKGTSVVLSVSPGAYVCNNTAFLLAHYFRSEKVPYGFIHLPPESCGGRLKSGTVREMAQLLKSLMGPHPGAVEPWPTDRAGVESLLSRFGTEHAPACDLKFAQGLEALYQ